MGRRITSISGLLLFCFVILTCDSSLISDIETKVTTDRITSGDIPSYTVTYFGNGSSSGEVPSDDTRYVEGVIAVISGNVNGLAKPGYYFNGWNTAADGSGTSYKEGDGIEIIANNIDLYAVWCLDTFSVSFNKNDPEAVGVMAPQEIPYGTYQYLNRCLFEKNGYTFIGWSTSPDGSVVYNDRQSFTPGTTDITLYAQWQYGLGISFDANCDDYSGIMSVQVASTGVQVTLDECAFSRRGYEFVGWTDSPSEDVYIDTYSIDYDDGDFITVGSKAKTLYAVWKAKSYNVSFNVAGGSGGSESVSVLFDCAMPVESLTPPTRTGYTFSGYWTEAKGGGTQYYTETMASAAAWGIAEDSTLYAKWIANTYTVTLDYSLDGDGSSSITVTAVYDSVMPTGLTAPTRDGYGFGGYWTEVNGGGDQYYTAAMAGVRTWDITSDTTLYAKWTAGVYTVTLNPGEGSGGTSSVTATYGTAMPAGLTAPARTGYSFAGYYSEGGVKQYYNSSMESVTNWNIASNTTLYASWEQINYTVNLTDNHNHLDPYTVNNVHYYEEMPAIGNQGLANSISTCFNNGYIFQGYFYTDRGDNGEPYYNDELQPSEGLLWTRAENGSLYARWKYGVTLYDPARFIYADLSVYADVNSPLPYDDRPLQFMDYAPEGRVFKGYYSVDGGTQYYNSDMLPTEQTWNVEAPGTIYALWNYEIRLTDPNELIDDIIVDVDSSGTLPSGLSIPYSGGWVFKGYYQSPFDDGGTQYYDSAMNPVNSLYIDPFYEPDSAILYAKWNCEVVLLDPKGFISDIIVEVDSSGHLPSGLNIAAPEGWVFQGYYETEWGNGGTQYYDSDMSPRRYWDSDAGPGVIFAHWESEPFDVEIINNGYEIYVPDSLTDVRCGEELPTITIDNYHGYSRIGLYTQEGGQGVQYYDCWDWGYELEPMFLEWPDPNIRELYLYCEGGP